MSNNELADWLNSEPATTASFEETLAIGKEIQRRLRSISDMIPRPKVEVVELFDGDHEEFWACWSRITIGEHSFMVLTDQVGDVLKSLGGGSDGCK